LKGLSAVPDINITYMSDEDEFLIIACDGLWDVLSIDQAVGHVRRSLAEYNDVQKASRDLVNLALRSSEG
jgi:protein phosphatase 2C family protein 2/3